MVAPWPSYVVRSVLTASSTKRGARCKAWRFMSVNGARCAGAAFVAMHSPWVDRIVRFGLATKTGPGLVATPCDPVWSLHTRPPPSVTVRAQAHAGEHAFRIGPNSGGLSLGRARGRLHAASAEAVLCATTRPKHIRENSCGGRSTSPSSRANHRLGEAQHFSDAKRRHSGAVNPRTFGDHLLCVAIVVRGTCLRAEVAVRAAS